MCVCVRDCACLLLIVYCGTFDILANCLSIVINVIFLSIAFIDNCL